MAMLMLVAGCKASQAILMSHPPSQPVSTAAAGLSNANSIRRLQLTTSSTMYHHVLGINLGAATLGPANAHNSLVHHLTNTCDTIATVLLLQQLR
jgi:hypothetical protein